MAQVAIEADHRAFADELVREWESAANVRLSEYARMLLRLASEAWVKEAQFAMPAANNDEFRRQVALLIAGAATREAHVQQCREAEKPVPLHTLMFALAEVGKGIAWLIDKGM